MNDLDLGHQIAAFVIAVLSAARITRLVVFDHYPPMLWLRDRWDIATERSQWNLLLHCGYCFGVWAALGVVLWGYFTDLNAVWWWVNGTLAAAYLAAIVTAYDGDD